MAHSEEKYPVEIRRLFDNKLPLPYLAPTDYPVQQRKTRNIGGIASFNDEIKKYIKDEAQPVLKTPQDPVQKKLHKESFSRQMDDWNNPELLQKNEAAFMKDPYKSVFISRLDYSLTEIDISKHFSKYGMVDSVRIIRDRQGKSRGYGFIAFEKDTDAKNCIRELASSGLKVSPEMRTILVDMERGRLVRNWLPRRLGGGLGGRHYTKSTSKSPNASAAASGRRLNLPINPYEENKKPAYLSTPKYTPRQQSYTPYKPAYQYQQTSTRSIREKYDKYT